MPFSPSPQFALAACNRGSVDADSNGFPFLLRQKSSIVAATMLIVPPCSSRAREDYWAFPSGKVGIPGLNLARSVQK
jgi:hypothetical protein